MITYRGYQLRGTWPSRIRVYFGDDFIDDYGTLAEARAAVDEWLWAP